MAVQVTLIDAGVGNLRSVQHALQTLGAEVLRTSEPQDVKSAARLVLPGVGAFGGFMTGLEQRGLIAPIREAAGRGIPLLGICVGMQALFELGLEMGEWPGLGLIPGRVVRFPEVSGLKVPHTGWNQFRALKNHPLLKGIPDGAYAYFNHSYYCEPVDRNDTLAETDYGIPYASIVQKDNLCGIQFHPEKSQRTGLALLANFLELA